MTDKTQNTYNNDNKCYTIYLLSIELIINEIYFIYNHELILNLSAISNLYIPTAYNITAVVNVIVNISSKLQLFNSHVI